MNVAAAPAAAAYRLWKSNAFILLASHYSILMTSIVLNDIS